MLNPLFFIILKHRAENSILNETLEYGYYMIAYTTVTKLTVFCCRGFAVTKQVELGEQTDVALTDSERRKVLSIFVQHLINLSIEQMTTFKTG